jgi:hypothetical protein
MADRLVIDDGNEVDLKDQQRISVRNRAINSPIKVSDNLYVMPITGGVMRNGFAQTVVRLSDCIWNSLSLLAIRRYRAHFDKYFLDVTGKPLPSDPVFHFRMEDSKTDWIYVITEEQTGSLFSLQISLEWLSENQMSSHPGKPRPRGYVWGPKDLAVLNNG